jgi:hypothetical protein
VAEDRVRGYAAEPSSKSHPDLVAPSPVGHTKHLTSQLLQPCLPSRITLQSARLRVNLSVKLNHQTQFVAIKVDDVTAQRLLTAELQAECFTVSQQVPRNVFSERF